MSAGLQGKANELPPGYSSSFSGLISPRVSVANNAPRDKARIGLETNRLRIGENMASEREVTDAKLGAVEARTETRFVELNGKIDRLAESMNGKIDRLTESVATLVTSINDTRVEVRADNKSTRVTIVIAVITSVVAGAALILTTQSTLLTAFQTGISVKSEARP